MDTEKTSPRTEKRDQMAQMEAKLSQLQEQQKRLTGAANSNISANINSEKLGLTTVLTLTLLMSALSDLRMGIN